MRRAASIILIFFAVNSVSISQDQPVTFNPNMLASSQVLPNDFLLFSPDTSAQILFNPARAGVSGSRFVYANYLPGSGSPLTVLQTSSLYSSYGSISFPSVSGPTISAAALFGDRASSWLLQLSNFSYQATNDLSSVVTSSTVLNPLTDESGSGSTVSSASLTAFKISHIRSSEGGSSSLGLFGIIFPEDVNADTHVERVYNSPSGDTSFTRRDLYDYASKSEGWNSKYEVGVEYGITRQTWDFLGSVTVQKNVLQQNPYATSYEQNGSTNPADTVSQHTTQYRSSSVANEPLVVSLHSYFQHATDVLSTDDHYFVSVNGYYSDGKLSVSQTNYVTEWYKHNSDPLSTDTTHSAFSQSQNAHNWGGSLSVGYLIRHRLIDIDVLIGFNPRLSYDEFKEGGYRYISLPDFYYQTPGIVNSHQLWSASAQIPIFLNYVPTSWLSLFGGLNYSYTYFYETIRSLQPDQSFYTQSTSTISELSASQTSSSLRSTAAVYAGAEFRHASGLHLQMAFRGNLTSYTSWNISVGYVY